MSAITVEVPFPVFTDTDGMPLDAGYIYIGSVGQNPEVYPIQAWWDQALSIPAAQPIRTIGGYASRNGSPGKLFIDGVNFSISVRDHNGLLVWSDQAATGISPDSSGVSFIQAGTGAVERASQEKMREQISLKDFGAVMDLSTNDTTDVAEAITAAGQANGSAYVNAGSALVTALSNPYGVEFFGPGEILKADPLGGYQRLNSYADKHKYAIGKEYLYRCYARFSLMNAGSIGTLKAFVYGDSTIAGGNGESFPFDVANLIPRLMRYKGLGNVSVTNRGVAGTQISDLNALPDLSATTDLIIIKYGINDGGNPLGTRLETFQSALREKLAAIRAAANGAVGNLAIILLGPNSTNDSVNGRDERWYEQLRGVYVQAARDYQCAYFDTYAYLKDSRVAATLWMDNPYANGIAIHPLNPMNAWIWGAVLDWAFPWADRATYADNAFLNQGSTGDSLVGNTWAAASLPSSFTKGIQVQRATIGNGAPIDGFCSTVINPDRGAIQTLWGYGAQSNVVLTRTADTGADTWNLWTGQPVAIPLSNAWVNQGAPWDTPRAILSPSGIVTVVGLITGGTTTAGTTLGTLPAGFRPPAASIFRVATAGGDCTLSVNADGTIKAHTAADGTYTSLSGISFSVA